jgi:hypothetical protein
MCTVLLPPGVNQIAVNKYINIICFLFIEWRRQISVSNEPDSMQKEEVLASFWCNITAHTSG